MTVGPHQYARLRCMMTVGPDLYARLRHMMTVGPHLYAWLRCMPSPAFHADMNCLEVVETEPWR